MKVDNLSVVRHGFRLEDRIALTHSTGLRYGAVIFLHGVNRRKIEWAPRWYEDRSI